MNDSIWKTVQENAKLKKQVAEQQERIEDLTTLCEVQITEIQTLETEIDILIRKKETLRDEICDLQAENERLEKILDKRCDACPAVSTAIRGFAKFLIEKGNGGVIYTIDLPEYVIEFLEKEGVNGGN